MKFLARVEIRIFISFFITLQVSVVHNADTTDSLSMLISGAYLRGQTKNSWIRAFSRLSGHKRLLFMVSEK